MEKKILLDFKNKYNYRKDLNIITNKLEGSIMFLDETASEFMEAVFMNKNYDGAINQLAEIYDADKDELEKDVINLINNIKSDVPEKKK